MTDTQQLAKIQAAIQTVKAEHIRLGEKILDLEKLADSEPTVGILVKKLFDAWAIFWASEHRTDYLFAGGKDAAGFKRLLKTMSVDQVKERMIRYINDGDPFLVAQKHPLSLFFSQINRWAPTASRAERPVGCHHEPPCESEAAHTRLMMNARKAVAR